MWDWDQLTMSLERVAAALLQLDNLRAHILVESVQHSTLRVLLGDVASHYLASGQRKELADLLIEVQQRAGVRNRLVHGRWQMIVKVHEGKPQSAEWARVMSVTDKETLFDMWDPSHQRSKPLKARNEFRTHDIHAEALKVKATADKLMELAGKLRVSDKHPPEPRSLRRRASQTQKKRPAR